ncbi:unnamed protein product, partial [Urochloa humidicola]
MVWPFPNAFVLFWDLRLLLRWIQQDQVFTCWFLLVGIAFVWMSLWLDSVCKQCLEDLQRISGFLKFKTKCSLSLYLISVCGFLIMGLKSLDC